ncbi:MAG TPA: hypothetical protein VLJ38_06375 [Polyangiaceae bacterium]|nr:hypothetical protein [Polyangiaceae bacterium]
MRNPVLAALLCVCSCHASVQGNAGASANGQGDAELEAEVQKERAVATPSAVASAAAPAPAPEHALLGARSDLTLTAAQGPTQCSCLRVVLGPATLGAFSWKGPPPAVDDERQLVMALTSEGTGCTNPKGSLGASYWGYRRRGNDVVVYVENGVAGRPLAQGAIIPKPLGSGQVYVAPVTKKLPFGKSPDSKGNCRIGNPGPARVAPVGLDETGAAEAPSGDDELLGR